MKTKVLAVGCAIACLAAPRAIVAERYPQPASEGIRASDADLDALLGEKKPEPSKPKGSTSRPSVAPAPPRLAKPKSSAPERHPRLMATPEVIAKVKKLAEVKGSHHEQALLAIRERVKAMPLSEREEDAPPPPPKPAKADPALDPVPGPGEAKTSDGDLENLLGGKRPEPPKPDASSPSPPSAKPKLNAKDYSRRASELAFLSLFADSETERAKLAAEAADLLEKAIELRPRTGLPLASATLNYAKAYDWAWPALPEERRAKLRAELLKVLDYWPGVARHWKGSNKQGVERGAEIMLILALNEEENRAERYAKMKEGLIQDYFEVEYSNLGVSQEGLGYTEFPSQFYWPAVHSARSCGDEDLFEAARKHASWKLGMYTHNFMPHARKFVMFGVDWSSNYDEGWASGLIPTAPADAMPYVLWWYDRHMGLKAPGELIERFDHTHGGNVMSLLLYPAGIEPKDPTGVFKPMIYDDQGRFFFRNRWQDANDIQATFSADAHDIPCGWDAPICFAFNLMGYDTRFFGGQTKSGGAAECSKLAIDGQVGHCKKTGSVVQFEEWPDGGWVLADGGTQYGEIGCTSARRHFALKFLPDNSALIATLDLVAVDRTRTITWQGNIGAGKETPEEHGVKIEAAPNGFLLRGRSDGTVRGWVLTPASAEIKVADPIQVSVKGEEAEIMVVLWIGKGEPPAAKIAGAGTGATLTIGGRNVRFHAGRLAIGD
jgi:hypothetical protein